MSIKLTVVLGTLNRLSYLRNALASIGPSAAGLWSETEVIIVDGGSTDGTLEFLRQCEDVRLIEQGAALGAVAAFNAGFRAAQSEYVAAFNDDAEYFGNTLELACSYLDSHPKCGQVAIPYRDPDNSIPFVQYVWLGRQRGKVRARYANFGVTRRALGDQVGWWGDYEHYAGDCELSANVWMAGYDVDELPGGEITHYSVVDSTRRDNIPSGSRAFYEKWDTMDVSALAARLNPGARIRERPAKRRGR